MLLSASAQLVCAHVLYQRLIPYSLVLSTRVDLSRVKCRSCLIVPRQYTILVCMPELPEVETVKRGLERLIVGRTVADVSHDWPKGFPNSSNDVDAFLIGARVESVQRRGKALVITLSTEYSILIHLKMTGQLVFVPNEQHSSKSKVETPKLAADRQRSTISLHTSPDEVRFGAGHPNESLVGHLPDKSTRVVFEFVDGSHLYFNDQRKFGWVKLLPSYAVQDDPFIKKLGPEPLDTSFVNTIFVQRMRTANKRMIKAALLDQSVLAGVGNIYADESLWAARIHPTERVSAVSDDRLRVLYTELIRVLKLSIEHGGSTDKTYVNAEGESGSYTSFAQVFRREGLPCTRCGSTIEKSKVAGRGTHTCPQCQA